MIRIGFLVTGSALATALALLALRDNLDFFYSPAAVIAGETPIEKRIRVGGMVLAGSLSRGPGPLDTSFVISDLQNAQVPVLFTGILPDLFREGQGVVAIGKLSSDQVFHASEVLAKHDENYMPPELKGVLAQQEEEEGKAN